MSLHLLEGLLNLAAAASPVSQTVIHQLKTKGK
jgi:hypothetical protein